MPYDAITSSIPLQFDSIKPKVRSESDLTFRILDLSLEGQYRFQYNPSESSIYIIGGVNYISIFRQKMRVENLITHGIKEISEQIDNSCGYTLGFGIDWPFQRERTAVSVEARFSKGVIQIDNININQHYIHTLAGIRVNL